MRLFLSSENLGNYPDEFVRLVNDKKLAYIGNAGDYKTSSESRMKAEEHRIQFEGLGIDFTKIDLRDYFGRQSELSDEIEKYDAIWCAGGNTFLLRSAFEQSGLDKVLIEKVKTQGFVYGGSSAGAILAGPTLKGTENGDDPKLVKEIYKKEICWSGLSLVDFVVVPHYESDWFDVESKEMEKYLNTHNLPNRILRDGQVIMIENGKEIFLK